MDLSLENMEAEGMEGEMPAGEMEGEMPDFLGQLKEIPMEEIIGYLKVEGVLPEDFEAPEMPAEEEMGEMPAEEGGMEEEGLDFSL